MKFRILTNGEKFRVQEKRWFLWSDCVEARNGLWGTPYDPVATSYFPIEFETFKGAEEWIEKQKTEKQKTEKQKLEKYETWQVIKKREEPFNGY